MSRQDPRLDVYELAKKSKENAIRLSPIGREILENSTRIRVDHKTIRLIRKK